MKHLLVSGLIFLAACGGRNQTGKIPVRIAVGGQAQLIYLAATLGQDLGMYDAEGLLATLQDFPGGQKSLEALLGGSTDVVCGFYDHTIQMAAKGKQLRAFVSILRYPGLVAVATPGIRRIEDLKGKIVGVSAAGSSTQMFLNYLLVTHGIKPDEVSVASIGMTATAVGAMTHGQVDAAIMTDPALEIVKKEMPKLTSLADTRTAEGVRQIYGVDAYPSVVLYSTPQWIERNHEAASRLALAMDRTLDWMRSHTPEEIRDRMGAQFRSSDAATDVTGLRYMQAMLSPDGRMTPESAAAVRKVLSISLEDVRDAKIDLGQTYTNEFAPAVNRPVK